MVLDIGLPGLDGFQVLSRLRDVGSTMPVIILSARDSIGDRVAGLQGGADDYMSKPFGFEELLARIRLRLRDPAASRGPDDSVLERGGLRMDVGARRVTVDGRDVDLSAREFALAAVFLRHPGQVLSRAAALARVGLRRRPRVERRRRVRALPAQEARR